MPGLSLTTEEFIEKALVIHYRVVNRSKNLEKSAQKTSDAQRNDEIKRKYCESNNIFLLTIPYWDQKNISDILSDFFHSLQNQRIEEHGTKTKSN